jgi:predicted alpha/beta hydrolase family esterase
VKEMLEVLGVAVVMPDMPNPCRPDRMEWVERLAKVVYDPANSVVIGHSIGGNTALHFAKTLNIPLAGIVLVATARDYGFDQLASFICTSQDLEEACKGTEQLLAIFGCQDPYVPVAAESLILKQFAEVIVCPDSGHFGRDMHSPVLLPKHALDAIVRICSPRTHYTRQFVFMSDVVGGWAFNS